MFRYETVVGANVPILDLDADSNTYVYNLDINNAQTLDKWVDYAGKCIQHSRIPEYYFRASYLPNFMIVVPILHPAVPGTNTSSSIIPYNNIINGSRIISSNYFLCTENGEYNFLLRLKDLIYAGTQYNGTCGDDLLFNYNGETKYNIEIRVFTDSTKTTLISNHTNTFRYLIQRQYWIDF